MADALTAISSDQWTHQVERDRRDPWQYLAQRLEALHARHKVSWLATTHDMGPVSKREYGRDSGNTSETPMDASLASVDFVGF